MFSQLKLVHKIETNAMCNFFKVPIAPALPTPREASYIPQPCFARPLVYSQAWTTLYTQLIGSSQATAELPPGSQVWGNLTVQSPPELGDSGGEKD